MCQINQGILKAPRNDQKVVKDSHMHTANRICSQLAICNLLAISAICSINGYGFPVISKKTHCIQNSTRHLRDIFI